MNLLALFADVEFEIQAMAWPRDHGKLQSATHAIELLRELRTHVISVIDSNDAQGPGTPDDVITTAQSGFHDLHERGELDAELAAALCAQLSQMRKKIQSNQSPLIVTEPEDAACYNE